MKIIVLLLFLTSCTPIVLETIVYRNVSPEDFEYKPRKEYIIPPIVYIDTCLTK